MDVLDDWVLAPLRRHVLVVHAVIDNLPSSASVGARPQARAGHADADVRRIARIDQHRIDAGLLAAGDTRPLPALGHMPQRSVQRPGFAAVIGAEKPAWHCACPNPTRNPARLECPYLAERPGMGIVTGILGLGR